MSRERCVLITYPLPTHPPVAINLEMTHIPLLAVTVSSPETPLYNHPLPEIEEWLLSIGCVQDADRPHCWEVIKTQWRAKLCLEIEEIAISYSSSNGSDVNRVFKYSLSRRDVEDAILAGP
jgi:Protein of unknown function (DUF3143)